MFSIVEGIVVQLKRNVPYITEISTQPDNAKFYQNGSLAFGLLMLLKDHNLSLRSCTHTEKKDSKGSIDAHFQLLRTTH